MLITVSINTTTTILFEGENMAGDALGDDAMIRQDTHKASSVGAATTANRKSSVYLGYSFGRWRRNRGLCVFIFR
jgi:hypothetical protein